MPGGREQAAVVVLAVDFDQMAADFAQQRRRTGLVVEEGAAAAIGLQRAADQQRLARLQCDLVIGEERRERRVRRGRGEAGGHLRLPAPLPRSEEHTSELQSLMRISYAVFCLKKKKTNIK